MEIKITVDIKGIEPLTEAIALLGSGLAYRQGMVATAEAAEKIAITEEKVSEKPEKVTKTKKKEQKEEEKEQVEESSEITMEEIREAFLAKNTKANTAKLKAILKEFGVAKVTDLEEKDFPQVLKALEEI